MSKEFIIPGPITLRDQATGTTGTTISFREWAFLSWLNDPRWHKDLARLVVVVQEFNKKEGQKATFEDADFAVLVECVKSPQAPQQPPLVAMQMEGYRVLVLRAGDVPSKIAT